MTENPWTSVRPVKPKDAEIEFAFLLMEAVHSGDAETFSEKVVTLINGIYLSGWMDCRETINSNIQELVKLYTTEN